MNNLEHIDKDLLIFTAKVQILKQILNEGILKTEPLPVCALAFFECGLTALERMKDEVDAKTFEDVRSTVIESLKEMI